MSRKLSLGVERDVRHEMPSGCSMTSVSHARTVFGLSADVSRRLDDDEA